MKIAVFVVTIALAGSAAADCREDLLTIEDWKVERITDPIQGERVSVQVKSHMGKPFRMVDGSYAFHDALGRHISSFGFNPDLKLAPGMVSADGGRYFGTQIGRVRNMDRADVKISTCVRAVVYEDGTKETFTAKAAASAPEPTPDAKTKAVQGAGMLLTLAYQCAPITGDRQRYERAKSEAAKLLTDASVKEPTLVEMIKAVEGVPRDDGKVTAQMCNMFLPKSK